MVTIPMKCKICGKVISPPDESLIIGEQPQVRNQKILHKLYSHMQSKMDEESTHAIQPHKQALIEATVAGENLKGALLVGNFAISAEMEAERQGVLARVHGMTRSVRLSEEDLLDMIEVEGMAAYTVLNYLRDLRDRYEGLGKYAPSTTPKEPTHAAAD